jgi:hypothetical protein
MNILFVIFDACQSKFYRVTIATFSRLNYVCMRLSVDVLLCFELLFSPLLSW